MRIGIVCPYSLDVPGGVQFHVRDLAETLIGLGHEVSVLAPAEEDAELPDYVVSAGRAVAVPYNGSIARLSFGPISLARVRKWLSNGQFDVLHVHEPVTPSLSLLAVLSARGPVVATFHTAMTRSKAMAAGKGMLQLVLERINGRIAVSALARKVQVEHLGGGAVPGWPGSGGAIGFLGRFTEPRKGFSLLIDAMTKLVPDRPDLRLLLAGPSDIEEVELPAQVAERLTFLGKVSEVEKARMLRSVDIYVAPNTGGESFGMILTEAMAAGSAIVASDLDAFRRVLDGGRAGALFPNGDSGALAEAIGTLLDDPDRRFELRQRATEVVRDYDWPVVAARVLEVYASAIDATPGRVVAD
jgi:phosphatidylinositol alpha-mannosyltransferase